MPSSIWPCWTKAFTSSSALVPGNQCHGYAGVERRLQIPCRPRLFHEAGHGGRRRSGWGSLRLGHREPGQGQLHLRRESRPGSNMSTTQPIDNLAPLANAGVHILHVCGSLDPSLESQTRIAEKRYQELGGRITVIIKEGEGIIRSRRATESRWWVSSSRASPPAAGELVNFKCRYWHSHHSARCNSLCLAPSAGRPASSLSGETSRAHPPDGDCGRAANPWRIDVAGDGAEDGRGVGDSFLA